MVQIVLYQRASCYVDEIFQGVVPIPVPITEVLIDRAPFRPNICLTT